MQELNASDFYNKIAEDKKVIVKMGSPYCTLCNELTVRLAPLIEQHPEMEFYEFDAQKNMAISDEFKVMDIPVLIAFKNGKEISRWDNDVGDLSGWLKFLNW